MLSKYSVILKQEKSNMNHCFKKSKNQNKKNNKCYKEIII